MAVINGNSLLLSIGGQTIGCTTNTTFSSQNEVIDVTCKDNDGAKENLSGGNTATITFEMFFNTDSTYGLSDILPLHQAGTLINWHFGDNTNLTMHGEGRINQLEIGAPLNGGVTASGTIDVSGAWTYSES
jgi:hypothetical protein